MDFNDLMNIASSNQQNAIHKATNKKSKDGGSSQVSSAAVKAFLARQNAEKAKQREQEEFARKARIQARLQREVADKSRGKKNDGETPRESVNLKTENFSQPHRTPKSQDVLKTSSKTQTIRSKSEAQKPGTKVKVMEKKDKERLRQKMEEGKSRPEGKKPETTSRKPVRPIMSFQELMSVAKQQADNPDAIQRLTAPTEPKSEQKRTVEKNMRKVDLSTKNQKTIKPKNLEKNTLGSRQEIRGKNVTSKISQKTVKSNMNEPLDRKLLQACDRTKPETLGRKIAMDGRQETLHRKAGLVTQQPKKMTIEHHTVSQREYEMPMRYQGLPKYQSYSGKRRHKYYDEDDDEYDDEMDEFIDDSEDAPDISSHIKEIFGYDRTKFSDRDNDTDNMESSFADIQREEAKSLRIAKLEDEVEKLKEAYELQQQQRKKKKLKR